MAAAAEAMAAGRGPGRLARRRARATRLRERAAADREERAARKAAAKAELAKRGGGEGEGGSGKPAKGWLIKSEAQNRPLRTTLRHDAQGNFLSRDSFASRHPIDRVVAYATAWHEGQLFGWINQAIGTATAIMLATLATTGFIQWRRRKPATSLGAPPATPTHLGWGLKTVVAALMLLLPLFTLSLLVLALLDRLILPRLPRAARWLGVEGK